MVPALILSGWSALVILLLAYRIEGLGLPSSCNSCRKLKLKYCQINQTKVVNNIAVLFGLKANLAQYSLANKKDNINAGQYKKFTAIQCLWC